MAASSNHWVSKDEIRGGFRGKTTTLDNALHALRTKKMIVPKEGEKGVYRLQHLGFAMWMMLHAKDPRDAEDDALAANVEGSK